MFVEGNPSYIQQYMCWTNACTINHKLLNVFLISVGCSHANEKTCCADQGPAKQLWWFAWVSGCLETLGGQSQLCQLPQLAWNQTQRCSENETLPGSLEEDPTCSSDLEFLHEDHRFGFEFVESGGGSLLPVLSFKTCRKGSRFFSQISLSQRFGFQPNHVEVPYHFMDDSHTDIRSCTWSLTSKPLLGHHQRPCACRWCFGTLLRRHWIVGSGYPRIWFETVPWFSKFYVVLGIWNLGDLSFEDS